MFYEEVNNIKQIGKGSFSEVYLVPSNNLNNPVIVKKFKKNNSEEYQESLNKEVFINMILKQYKKNNDGQENITTVESYYGELLPKEQKSNGRDILKIRFGLLAQKILGINNDIPSNLLLFKYKPCITLKDYIICKTSFSKEYDFKNRKLLIDILKGVKFIHEIDICHHDLKPENIIIEFDPNKTYKAKLIDFGLATCNKFKYSNGVNYNNNLCKCTGGTIQFTSPEKLSLSNIKNIYKTYDGYKSDIWSIGVLYYNLCFRIIPFKKANNELNILNFLENDKKKIETL